MGFYVTILRGWKKSGLSVSSPPMLAVERSLMVMNFGNVVRDTTEMQVTA